MSRVVHFEVAAQDVERASAFYRDAFSWQTHDWEGPVPYRFLITGQGEAGIDGAVTAGERSAQAVVLTIDVPSVEEAERRHPRRGKR